VLVLRRPTTPGEALPLARGIEVVFPIIDFCGNRRLDRFNVLPLSGPTNVVRQPVSLKSVAAQCQHEINLRFGDLFNFHLAFRCGLQIRARDLTRQAPFLRCYLNTPSVRIAAAYLSRSITECPVDSCDFRAAHYNRDWDPGVPEEVLESNLLDAFKAIEAIVGVGNQATR